MVTFRKQSALPRFALWLAAVVVGWTRGDLDAQTPVSAIAPENRDPAAAFLRLDADRNGTLSADEYVRSQPEANRPKARRDLGVVDWDSDGQLSLAEFRCLPSSGPPALRGPVPDSIADEAAERIAMISGRWNRWDQNGDGMLQPGEFEATRGDRAVPGLQSAEFAAWDLDRDGLIQKQEARRVIEMGYGLRMADGFDLRAAPGVVFNLMSFTYNDANRDGVLESSEMQQRMRLSAEVAQKRIAELDRNGDQKLSMEEARPLMEPDVIAQFLGYDLDLDGKIDLREWLAKAPDWQRSIAGPAFFAFDENQDGRLTFREFRSTPQANPLAPWHESRRDLDGDGGLSLKEYVWNAAPLGTALEAQFFARFDRNRDGTLDLSEQRFYTPRLDPASEFRRLDMDADGTLTLEEAQWGAVTQNYPIVKRDFAIFDLNGDGALSLDEFRANPSVALPQQRGPLPDPLLELVESKIAALRAQFEAAEKSRNGELNAQEFAASKLSADIPGLKDAPFKLWDLNQDGLLAASEAVTALRLAYGVIRTDGQLLRFPSGRVVNWMSFKRLDANRDDRIDRDEYVKNGIDGAQSENRYREGDQDGDGFVTFPEFVAHNGRHPDPIAVFLQADKDFDGLLTREELIAGTPGWQKPLVEYIFPGFDTDQDHRLSLAEYRMTPLANLQQTWQSPRQDRDQDGMLSFAEFTDTNDLDALALAAEFFRRFDLSQDGLLSQDEFFFHTSRRDPQREYRKLDANGDGRLELTEFLAGTSESQRLQTQRDFAVIDWNADGVLSLDEFRCWPRLFVPDLRGSVPDPIAEAAAVYLTAIEQRWAAWDRHPDGQIKPDEFTAFQRELAVPGLPEQPIAVWDLDRNGSVSKAEAQRIVEAAFGLKLLDGFELRTTAGTVFGWEPFQYMDADKTGTIELADFTKRNVAPEEAQRRMERADRNKDHRVSREEARALYQADLLANFLWYDKDFDGRLSHSEWLGRAPGHEAGLVEQTFAAFDGDGDGRLSFVEYRAAPQGNQLAAWHSVRQDKNSDGVLSRDEFTWGAPPFLSALEERFFRALDRNGDGALDQDEFPCNTSLRDPAREFAKRDADRDGKVVLNEYLSNVAADQQPQYRRDFNVFDADHDGALTLSEFSAIPQMAGTLKRIAPQDPVVAFAEQLAGQVAAQLQSADANRDGALDETEFQRSTLARDTRGLQLTRWQDWDMNRDGRLTVDEARRLIDAACGVARLDGAPCRAPSGIVFNVMLFGHVDQNHDNLLSRAEYLERGYGGAKAAENFGRADKNRDQTLTYAEWIADSAWWVDPFADFLKMDKDFDGEVSAAELRSGVPDWLQTVAEACLPGFDDDRNGKLSLAEYRFTPMANRVAVWQNAPYDRDGDGKVSFAEFHTATGIELRAMAYEYFRRFDRNGDGRLDLDEYRYRLDTARVPPELAFRYRDTNGDQHLTLDELLVDLRAAAKQPKNQGAQVNIGRVEEAFQEADANADKRLSFAEFNTDAGRRTINPQPSSKRNLASTLVSRSGKSGDGFSWRLVALIGLNVVLVGGVGWYVLFRKSPE